MIKDVYMRILFIPLLGIMLPFISGIIDYSLYSLTEMLVANIYFMITSYCIWTGSSWVHGRLRPLFGSVPNPFTKIAAVSLATALYGTCIGGVSVLAWYKFSKEILSWTNVYIFEAICILAVIVFTLVYEILFLSNEREEDSILVKKMDLELTHAELQALKNEMDPHFIFNSLNAMSHLILNNPMRAHLFNNNLSQVFKYFLLNKNKTLIPLQEELAFIESYFFLLEIRYESKIRLQMTLGENVAGLMIPPCAMQVLIENAIKHNEFSTAIPLNIKININGQFLKVSNNKKLKLYAHNSTNIGLKNLSLRFNLACKKEIIIQNSPDFFTVLLPLINH